MKGCVGSMEFESDTVVFEEFGQESEKDLSISPEQFSQAVLWGTDWTTETIMRQLHRGNIDVNPRFQRRNAWKKEQKSKFIESVILGIPVPPVILAERKDRPNSFIVIDGKQRLLSIRQFSAEENEEYDQLFLKNLEILKELNGFNYKELCESPEFNQYLTNFDNQTIRAVIIRNWPSEDFLYTVFHRLNTGSLPLSPQELRQALHPGGFLDFVEVFSSESKPIQRVLNITEPDSRMRDVELVIRFFSFRNFIKHYTGKLKGFLDETSRALNEKWLDQHETIRKQAEELEEAILFTQEVFGEKAFRKWVDGRFSSRFNRAVYDIMVYYFSIPDVRRELRKDLTQVESAFIELCEEDQDFLQSFEANASDLKKTVKRYQTWGEKLSTMVQVALPIPSSDGTKVMVLEGDVYGANN